MKKYGNKSGNSGIFAYELGIGFIRIKFVDGTIYRYTQQMIGLEYFNKMCLLAQSDRGLNTFISLYIMLKKNTNRIVI